MKSYLHPSMNICETLMENTKQTNKTIFIQFVNVLEIYYCYNSCFDYSLPT